MRGKRQGFQGPCQNLGCSVFMIPMRKSGALCLSASAWPVLVADSDGAVSDL